MGDFSCPSIHSRNTSRAAADAEGKLLAGFMGTGIFEQCHFLMGFEDTLTALYEHPDEMHELIETITQYRLDYVRRLIDGLQPDVIFSHDCYPPCRLLSRADRG